MSLIASLAIVAIISVTSLPAAAEGLGPKVFKPSTSVEWDARLIPA